MTLAERIQIRHQERKNKQVSKKGTTKVMWLDQAYNSKRYTGSKVYSDRNQA